MKVSISVPEHLTHIVLSQNRRAKYYGKGDPIPKKYQKCRFNNKGQLIDESGKPIVKNTRTAGTPRLKKISSHEMYSGNLHPKTRSKMVKEMKDFFKPFFKNIPPIEESEFPLKITYKFYEVIVNERNDVDNIVNIYEKVLQDVLVESGILKDDNFKIINNIETEFYRVYDEKERKVVVTIENSKI